jgi:thioredoxin reductase (NADPH)
MEKYDLIIIGSGPAGYSASIYASRYKMNHIVVGEMPGGAGSYAHKVFNYPGYKEITGVELMMKMKEQALSYGVELFMDRVVSVKKEGNFVVETKGMKSFESKAVLIATGTKRITLDIPSENKFKGKGISYCATCDGMLYKDKVVAVVGGANAANMSAVYLSDIAKKVYVIYRRESLRGEQMWIDEVMSKENIEVIFNANVVEFLGDDILKQIRLDKDDMVVDVDGVFVEIGSKPSLDFNPGVDLCEQGYIKVDNHQKTSAEGIYAAGDITTNSASFHQVVTACSEGAVAAHSIYYWLKRI